ILSKGKAGPVAGKMIDLSRRHPGSLSSAKPRSAQPLRYGDRLVRYEPVDQRRRIFADDDGVAMCCRKKALRDHGLDEDEEGPEETVDIEQADRDVEIPELVERPH